MLDSYGTVVPGAEVRLMMPDGGWCIIPDNPARSGISTGGGGSGYFEFENVPQGQYLLNAVIDNNNGSITLNPGAGDNYVEITIPGYEYQRPAQCVTVTQATVIDDAVPFSEPSVTTTETPEIGGEYTLPDVWRLMLGCLIIFLGAFIAAFVFKKR